MKKNWQTERKWEMNKVEVRFEKLLKDNGFTIIGLKEFVSKTDYLIEKDGIQCQYSLHHVGNQSSQGNMYFKIFTDYYNIQREYYDVLKEFESN